MTTNKNNILKTTILNTTLITTNIKSQNLINILDETINTNELIDFDMLNLNKNALINSFLLNPNILLNINIDKNTFNEDEIIEGLINGEINKDACKIEILSGIEFLNTIQCLELENLQLILNLTINLSNDNKIFILDSLNYSISKSVLFNRKLDLKLIDEDSIFIYNSLKILNKMENSPIKNRINFIGDVKENRLNANSIIKCVEKYKVLNTLQVDNEEILAKLISNILTAYKMSFKDILSTRKKSDIKMCDIRYALGLTKAFYEYCKANRIYLSTENIYEMFEIIKKEDENIYEKYIDSVHSESAINKLAKKHSNILLKVDNYYDPTQLI